MKKENMISTKDLTREKWLELRRNGIGGSDASVVMGKNPGVPSSSCGKTRLAKRRCWRTPMSIHTGAM